MIRARTRIVLPEHSGLRPELQRRLAEAWSGFRSFSEGWLEVERGYGRDAVERVYEATLAGRSDPRHGHVLSLWDSA